MGQRGEYTPIQISFDLGSPIHREALFQVLLTLEQEEPEGLTLTAVEHECGNRDDCYPSTGSPSMEPPPYEPPVNGYGDIGDDLNG